MNDIKRHTVTELANRYRKVRDEADAAFSKANADHLAALQAFERALELGEQLDQGKPLVGVCAFCTAHITEIIELRDATRIYGLTLREIVDLRTIADQYEGIDGLRRALERKAIQ